VSAPRQQQAEDIAKIVSGIGNESNRVRHDSEYDLGYHQRDVERRGDSKYAVEVYRSATVVVMLVIVSVVVWVTAYVTAFLG
jgi:hypothetical protein